MCNVNERVILKAVSGTSQSSEGQNVLTSEKIEEHTENMFGITCSGATLSKDRDLMAIGDFTGNVKVFRRETGEQVAQT